MSGISVRGTLILVVGPSGVGKDTLIGRTRTRLADDDAIAFARRCITRPAEPGGEAHEPMSVGAFDRLRRDGAFMLAWEAHGCRYGIHRRYDDVLTAGRAVVANVSRTVIDEARRRFQPLSVIHVTAAPETLARWLAERDRESAGDREARLRRAVAAPAGDDVTTLCNDGRIEEAEAAFTALLSRIAGGSRGSCAAE